MAGDHSGVTLDGQHPVLHPGLDDGAAGVAQPYLGGGVDHRDGGRELGGADGGDAAPLGGLVGGRRWFRQSPPRRLPRLMFRCRPSPRRVVTPSRRCDDQLSWAVWRCLRREVDLTPAAIAGITGLLAPRRPGSGHVVRAGGGQGPGAATERPVTVGVRRALPVGAWRESRWWFSPAAGGSWDSSSLLSGQSTGVAPFRLLPAPGLVARERQVNRTSETETKNSPVLLPWPSSGPPWPPQMSTMAWRPRFRVSASVV